MLNLGYFHINTTPNGVQDLNLSGTLRGPRRHRSDVAHAVGGLGRAAALGGRFAEGKSVAGQSVLADDVVAVLDRVVRTSG